MKNTCPVCGYDNLRRPAADYSICPCCRTEFGVSDYSWSHDELRKIWLERGANWGSKRVAEPPEWSPVGQLKNISYQCTDNDLRSIAKSRNEAEVGAVVEKENQQIRKRADLKVETR